MRDASGSAGRSDPDTHDVLVVGGGAVGLALAIRLARRDVRVLVLEAGPASPPVDYERYNEGGVVGLPHRGIKQGRMRALGGTTRLWGGQLVPFGARDFDGDTVDGPSPWPIRHAEMAPAFAAAFDFLGVGDADQEVVWRRATDLPAELGARLRLGLNLWLPQPDFAKLFAADLAGLESLQVLTDHPVSRLLFSDRDGVLTEVEVTLPAGTTKRFRAPHVVLAAGTLENVRLLLRTAAIEPACGFAGNRHIGGGYIDHLHGIAGRIRPADPGRIGELFDNIYVEGRKYSVKVRAADVLRAEAGIANCAATINTPATAGGMMRDLSGLARRIVARPKAGELARGLRQSLDFARILLPLAFRYLARGRSTMLLSGGVWLGLELEQIVTPKSYLFLDPAAPAETAAICLHWDFDGREMEAAAVLCAEVAAAFEAAGLGTIELDPRIERRDPAFLLSCHDSSHQMGGARMAKSAEDGVVDANLRVFGTENLHVLGACVFPTGSFANPTLTALALAMRLSDRLAAEVRSTP